MIWLSRISTDLRSCCDVLFVRARILAFRSAMKVQTCHLPVLLLRFPLDAEAEMRLHYHRRGRDNRHG